jgi:hypothetical protein
MAPTHAPRDKDNHQYIKLVQHPSGRISGVCSIVLDDEIASACCMHATFFFILLVWHSCDCDDLHTRQHSALIFQQVSTQALSTQQGQLGAWDERRDDPARVIQFTGAQEAFHPQLSDSDRSSAPEALRAWSGPSTGKGQGGQLHMAPRS